MFWKKKKQSDDVWGVIVNPLTSDLEKAELIEKLMEVLPFSMEEASQLVERTPLVLFDSLPLATASELKIYFKHLGIDVLTTNDDQIKKKCFKVVWPKQPRFDFLRKPDHTVKETIPEQQRPVAPKQDIPPAPAAASLPDTIDEILKSADTAAPVAESTASPTSGSTQESAALVDDLYAELEKLKESNEVFGRASGPAGHEAKKPSEEKPLPPPAAVAEPKAPKQSPSAPVPEAPAPVVRSEDAVVPLPPSATTDSAGTDAGLGDEIEALYQQLEMKRGEKDSFKKKENAVPDIAISNNTVHGEEIKEEKKVDDINAVIADLEKKEQSVRTVFEPSQKIVLPKAKEFGEEKPGERKIAKKKEKPKTQEVLPSAVIEPKPEVSTVSPAPVVPVEPKVTDEVHLPVQETSDMFKQIDLLFDSMTAREPKDKKKSDVKAAESVAANVREAQKPESGNDVSPVKPLSSEPVAGSAASTHMPSKAIDQLKTERDQFRAKADQLERDIVLLKAELTQVMTARETAENEKIDALREMKKMQESMVQKDVGLAQLQSSIAQVEVLRKEKDALEVRIQEMSMASEQMRMEYELKVHDLSERAETAAPRIAELQSTIDALEAEKAAFELKRVEIADKIRTLLNVNRDLQHFKAEAEALRTDVQKNKRDFDEALAQKEREQVTVSEQFNQLTRRFEDVMKENDLLKVEVGQLKGELRKFTSEREKMELIQRRAQVQTSIKEQELKLAKLSEDHAKIIKELEERQSVMQQLSTMRAEIEKVLSDARQSEKYILETLMKKDKPRQGRSSSEETESA